MTNCNELAPLVPEQLVIYRAHFSRGRTPNTLVQATKLAKLACEISETDFGFGHAAHRLYCELGNRIGNPSNSNFSVALGAIQSVYVDLQRDVKRHGLSKARAKATAGIGRGVIEMRVGGKASGEARREKRDSYCEALISAYREVRRLGRSKRPPAREVALLAVSTMDLQANSEEWMKALNRITRRIARFYASPSDTKVSDEKN